MHKKFVWIQLFRGWAKSVLWVVLLAAVVCFLTVSAGQWNISRQNLAAMDQVFTTVAVVDDIGFWRNNEPMYPMIDFDGSVIRTYGVDKSGDIPDPEVSFWETVENLNMVKSIDYRQSSRAFSLDIFSVVHPLEPLEVAIARHEADRSGDFLKWQELIAKYGHPFYDWELQEGVSSAILKAKCTSMDVTTSYGLGLLNYSAVFEIDHCQSPVVHPFHENFKYLEITARGILPSYQFPFTVGKDYLLATDSLYPEVFLPQYGSSRGMAELCAEPEWFLKGLLQDAMLLDVPGNERELIPDAEDYWEQIYSPFTEDVATALGISFDEYPFQRFRLLDDNLILSAQELTGSVADFLESEKGEPWRLAIEIANKNTHALSAVGTNNLRAIIHFNRQDAHILEGREFSQDEYNEGAKVCIISTSLARENGLMLGDELRLSMQKTGYRPFYRPESNSVYWHEPLKFTSSCLEFSGEESYRIIGMYTAPEWDYQYNSFTPNTIFIPLKAFPEGIPQALNLRCEERGGMLSLVLKNGSQDAFLESIAGTGLDGKVQVLDQGYGRIASQILTLWGEARSLFIVSSLVWGIVAVFFFLLITRRLHPVLGIMVSLGVRRRHIRQFVLGYIAIICLCGLLIGGTVGTVVYQGVIAKTYDSLQESAADLPFALAAITPRLPIIYILLQGLILILLAVVIALTVPLNVRSLLHQGMQI